jgi:hypothetical protein
MLASPATLRRLAEQHNYPAIRDLLAEAGASTPGERVLEALALAHLGHEKAAREILASLDLRALDLDVRVDLAAVRMALGVLPPERIPNLYCSPGWPGAACSRVLGKMPSDTTGRASLDVLIWPPTRNCSSSIWKMSGCRTWRPVLPRRSDSG